MQIHKEVMLYFEGCVSEFLKGVGGNPNRGITTLEIEMEGGNRYSSNNNLYMRWKEKRRLVVIRGKGKNGSE